MLCRVRESAGAIYRSRVRAIPEGAIGASLSDLRLADHCKTLRGNSQITAVALDMGMLDSTTRHRNITTLVIQWQ